MGETLRISELITVEKINKWKLGAIITIDAQTGKGKSYFVKNILYAIAKRDKKKILFLVHRKTVDEQFVKELKRDKKLDVIEVRTYQHIDSKYRAHQKFDFSDYQYIICDEFHYHTSDSAFNEFTDLSLNAILKEKDKTRIFMSATGRDVTQYINNHMKLESINYQIPHDYSHIKKLEFYKRKESVHDYITSIIASDKKGLVFVRSAKEAYDLHLMYKEYSMFLCGESNKLYKHVDKNKVDSMLENERFEDKLLITTLTLEAGVNLRMADLTEIVCDVGYDVGILLQAFGRKRIEMKTDYINLYIKAVTNNRLGGIKSQLIIENQIAMNFCLTTDTEFAKANYRKKLSPMIYDEPTKNGIEKRLNMVRWFKVQKDLELIEKMLELKNNNLGYCLYVSKLLGIPYTIKEEGEVLSELEIYLESLVGKMLFADERWDLIKKIGLKDKNSKLQKGLKTINSYLNENNINYQITSHVDKRRKLSNGDINDNRDKTYWTIN